MHSARERLQAWIDRSKLTQGQAAAELDIERSFLSQILSGRRIPGLDTAARVEAITGIPASAWAASRRDGPSEPVPVEVTNRQSGNE